MLDLNDLVPTGSGWVLEFADDINSSGQIVGEGFIDGEFHAFLLTPVPPNCVNPPQMDTNNDCQVNLIDFAVFASEWLVCGYENQSDCQ